MLTFLLGLSPRMYWGIGIALALGAAWIGHRIDVSRHEKRAFAAGQAETQTRWDAAEKVRAETAAKAEAAARAEEQRRATAQQEIARANEAALSQARADAAGAADAAEQLRRHVAWLLTRSAGGGATGDPAAPVDRATATAIGNLLGECVEAYRGLAVEADAARNAGLAAERAYESLTP